MENLLLYKNLINTKNLKYFSRYLLYLYSFSLVFERIFPLAEALSIPKVTAVLYCLSIVINPRFHDSLIKIPTMLILLIALFMFTNILNGGLIVADEIKAIDQTFLLNVFIFWVAYTHNKADPFIIRKALYVYAVSMCLLVIAMMFGFYEVDASSERIFIGGSLPNDLGINATYSFIILLMFYESYENRKKYLVPVEKNIIPIILIFAPLLVYLVILTGSRSAFLSVFAAGLIFFLIKYGVRSSLIFLVVTMALVVTSGVFFLRFSEFVLFGEIGGRLELITFSFQVIKEHYLLGVGRQGYDNLANLTFGASPSPHNVFMETFMYGGLPAFVTLLLIMYKLFQASYREYKQTGFICAVLLLLPLLMRGLSGQIYNSKIAFLIFAFLISLSNDYLYDIWRKKGKFLHFRSNL